MHLLFETPIGFSLFEIQEDKLDTLLSEATSKRNFDDIQRVIKLAKFEEFDNPEQTLRQCIKIQHSKLGKTLNQFLVDLRGKLLVGDMKLASEISKKLGLQCESGQRILEVVRIVRAHLERFIGKDRARKMREVQLGLAHGLGRFRIKFSSEKVDVMIIQAVNLFQDLDKEINNYMMRLNEWYGYHFPELVDIIKENKKYVLVIQ